MPAKGAKHSERIDGVKRARTIYTLAPATVETFARLAKRQGVSASRLLENLMNQHNAISAMASGSNAPDSQPTKPTTPTDPQAPDP
jgi:predicted DNA-binding ribbon-helix-helix protein